MHRKRENLKTQSWKITIQIIVIETLKNKHGGNEIIKAIPQFSSSEIKHINV